MRMFSWFAALGFEATALAVRRLAAPSLETVPYWTLVNLPDALWVYSFTVGLGLLWEGVPLTRAAGAWVLLPFALGIGGEIGQRLGLVHGTFDMRDVLAMSAAELLALAVIRSRRRSPRHA